MRDDGPCCSADAARRTSRIWVAGNNVGIIELERIFEEVYRMDLGEDDAITDALVERAGSTTSFLPKPWTITGWDH